MREGPTGVGGGVWQWGGGAMARGGRVIAVRVPPIMRSQAPGQAERAFPFRGGRMRGAQRWWKQHHGTSRPENV